MKNGGNFPPPVPFANATTKFNPNMERNRGQRFYLGSYIFATNQSPQVPTPLPTGEATAENAVPSIGVFEFMRTDLTFEVDTGYDNPANIANKITQDFHAGNATPQLFNLDQNGGALPAYSATNAIGPPIQLADLGVWTENTCCYTLPAYPPNAEREIMYKLGDDIPFRGCWKCAECLKIKRQYRKPVSSWKELTPYWDCDDCCCVDIRGQKRHLPVGFLKHIAKAKGIEVASLKATMLKK
jgi:hypothetical protein